MQKAFFDKERWLKKHEKTDIPFTVETFDGKQRPPSPIEARYINTNFPGGMSGGMLTNLGRDQAYDLGQRIRNRYIQQFKLISEQYEEKHIMTRSTNVNRCVQSLQCVVAGMFERHQLKDTLKIKMLPAEDDILFPNAHKCPTLRTLNRMYKPYVQTLEGYKFLSMYIKYFIGDETDSYIDMMSYRDEYVARKSHGLEVPPWLEAANKQVQKEAARVVAAYSTGTKDDHYVTMQLSVGPVFHLIIQNFEQIIKKDKSVPKLHLFSGHDTTLVPILVGLGVYEEVWPPYSSDVAFELYEDSDGGHYIKVLYMQKEVILPGFEEAMIPLEEFKKALAPFTTSPMQYRERCHNMELARENAEFWEAMKATKDAESDEYPSNI